MIHTKTFFSLHGKYFYIHLLSLDIVPTHIIAFLFTNLFSWLSSLIKCSKAPNVNNWLLFSCATKNIKFHTKGVFKTCQTSMIELLCENSKRLLAIDNFNKKAQAYMLDRILYTPLNALENFSQGTGRTKKILLVEKFELKISPLLPFWYFLNHHSKASSLNSNPPGKQFSYCLQSQHLLLSMNLDRRSTQF